MRNVLRQLQKLEGRLTDATGLVPHSDAWFAFWEDKLDRSMNGEDFFGSSFLDRRHLVVVSLLLQSCIALPGIGMHCAAGLDAIFNERMQAGGRGVLDYSHANPTDAPSVRLRRYHNQCLVLNSPAYNAFLGSAQVGLVHFNPASQPIATGSNHRAPQFVEPRPGGSITAESEDPLQAQGAGAVFWLVTNHIARNQTERGFRVSWNTVPAVTDV